VTREGFSSVSLPDELLADVDKFNAPLVPAEDRRSRGSRAEKIATLIREGMKAIRARTTTVDVFASAESSPSKYVDSVAIPTRPHSDTINTREA